MDMDSEKAMKHEVSGSKFLGAFWIASSILLIAEDIFDGVRALSDNSDFSEFVFFIVILLGALLMACGILFWMGARRVEQKYWKQKEEETNITAWFNRLDILVDARG